MTEAAPLRRELSIITLAFIAAVVGFAVGVVTQILQGHGLGSWAWVANSGGPWLLTAFGCGALTRRVGVGAALGVLSLVGANLGYAAGITWLEHGTSSTSTTVFWIIIGVIGGPIFGAAGALWRERRPRWAAIGCGALAAVFVAEGIRGLWFITPRQHGGWEQIVIGVILALALTRTWRDRLIAVATMFVLQPAMVLVFAAIDHAR